MKPKGRTWVAILAMTTTMSIGMPDLGLAQSLPEALRARSAEATTSLDHAALARDFRLRAERLEAEEAAHEVEVRRIKQSAGPIGHKWPSMVPGLQRAQERAAAAGRAAQESRQLASRHAQRATETQVAAR